MGRASSQNWEEVGTSLLRGVGGGVIIGIPLLYTMEIWWIGSYLGGWRLAGFLLTALVINFGLNYASGFSAERGTVSALRDSVVALGASAVVAAIVLVLVGALPAGYPFAAALGKVALGAIPVSIGFSVANTQFAGRTGRGEDEGEETSREPDIERRRMRADLIDIGITIAGATLFVFAVAPTQEILLITERTNGYQWAGLVAFSLVLTYAMVFEADFVGTTDRRDPGLLQRPIPETLLAYTFAVLTGMLLLFLLGRTQVFSSVSAVVGHAAVIGLPAAVGGAAGRLLV